MTTKQEAERLYKKVNTSIMKKALLVIDMQNDFLAEGRRKRFSFETEKLIPAVNTLIARHKDDCDVIYIKQIVQNNPINRLIAGFTIRGTKGAELYDGVDIVSEYCFEKLLPDAFTSRKLRAFFMAKGYDTVALCGLDEGGCVSATAKGALKFGLSVEMLMDGIATVFCAAKIEKLRKKLKGMGVKYITNKIKKY